MHLRYGLFLAFAVACSGSSPSYSTSPPPPAPSPPPAPGGTASVTISHYSFSPDTMTIFAGQAVRWRNDDSVSHSVSSDTGTTLNSGTIGGTGRDSYGNPTGGGSYTHTLYSKGIFAYHCSIHPTMKGVVIVN